MYSIDHLKRWFFTFRSSFLASHIESLFLTKCSMEDFMIWSEGRFYEMGMEDLRNVIEKLCKIKGGFFTKYERDIRQPVSNSALLCPLN